jgi:hypothetical protein
MNLRHHGKLYFQTVFIYDFLTNVHSLSKAAFEALYIQFETNNLKHLHIFEAATE